MNLRNPTLLSRSFLVAVGGVAMTLVAGCSSTGSSNAASSSAKADAAEAKAMAETKRVVANLDREYVIGPTAASELNYRVVWQYENPADSSLKGIALRGDSVYTLDDRNFLSRINISDGQRRWRVHAADEVLAVTSFNVIDERAYLTAGSQMLVLDVVNGSPIAKWKLDRVSGTQPAEWGDYLIYGSRGGDIVWLNRNLGFIQQAYHISPTLRVPPVIRGNAIATVGVSGEVVLLNASTATKFWDKNLLSPVSCRPVIGDEMVYVSGEDQYIWGLDIRSGRASWKYLTTAALKTSPTLVADRLFQQVPGTGLLCLNAVPIDLPGGELLWTNEKATGNVILARNDDLYVWDALAQRVFVLDAIRGLTKTRIDLPQAAYLFIGGENSQELFAASVDGRVVRLAPRN